jgi:hypothetical protein
MPPSQIKSNVPHGLELICLKAMSKLPEDRYQGAAAFADDLCHWLDDEPISAEKTTLLSKVQRWIRRHRAVLMGGLGGLICLVIVLVCVNAWITGQSSAPLHNNEFDKFVQAEGSSGTQVWAVSSEGKLLLSCQVQPVASETHHVLSLHTSAENAWDLSKQAFLTFSLLEIPSEGKSSLQNFSIRLGQGQSYYEIKAADEFWEQRGRSVWIHPLIPIQRDASEREWTREVVGTPDMEKIERLEIHFDVDSEITLNFDNFQFLTAEERL